MEFNAIVKSEGQTTQLSTSPVVVSLVEAKPHKTRIRSLPWLFDGRFNYAIQRIPSVTN